MRFVRFLRVHGNLTNGQDDSKTNYPKTKIDEAESEVTPEKLSRVAMSPEMQAAVTISRYGRQYGKLDLTTLVQQLSEQTKATSEDNSEPCEAMLTAQSHTLNALFHSLAMRAQGTEYLQQLDTYLKLALRAQSQCRATWEAISTIKNPPLVGYVKQANTAQGHQQVNNARAPTTTTPFRPWKNQNAQIELLEQNDGERLDTGTAEAAGGVDPPVETVGEVYGAEE